jgi:hypothetical protein
MPTFDLLTQPWLTCTRLPDGHSGAMGPPGQKKRPQPGVHQVRSVERCLRAKSGLWASGRPVELEFLCPPRILLFRTMGIRVVSRSHGLAPRRRASDGDRTLSLGELAT